MMIRHCIILAAGKNSRLDTGKPKSLLEVEGIALLEHHLNKFKAVGVEHFCVVTGHNPEPIRGFVKNLRGKYPVTIDLVHNERYDLENGYSLNAAKEWVKTQSAECFYLTMGDHYFQPAFIQKFNRTLEAPKYDLALYLAVDAPGEWNSHIDIEDVTRVLANDRMQIEAIGKLIANYNYYDTGLFAMTGKVFEALDQCFSEEKYTLSNMVSALISASEAEVILIEGYFWNDVDNPDDLQNTRKLLNE